MLHSWQINIRYIRSILQPGQPNPTTYLKFKNYGKDKLTRINENAGAWQPDDYPLYNPKTFNCNISACEHYWIEVESHINYPIDIDSSSDITLRDYQHRPLSDLIKKPYWLLYADVGFGKSYCIIRLVNQLKGKTVILTNTIINAQQLVEWLEEKFPGRVGQYGGSKHSFNDITVCVYPSYKKLLKEHNGDRDITIYDEAHLLISEKYRINIIETKCQYKYGMTGTPSLSTFHTEDFVKFWWRLVDATEYRQILGDAFNIKVTFVKLRKEIKEYRDRHHLKELAEANPERLNIVTRLVTMLLKEWKKILVMTDRKETSERIGWHLDIPFITAEVSTKKRKEVMLQFEKKRVLVATRQILWVGFNNPEVDAIIVCFSWREEANVIQASGRAMRIYKDKQDITIYDIIDNSPIFENQARARKRAYKNYTNDFTVIDMKNYS